jgi:N-acetylmuramoyl-L-alanine amidase
MIGICIGHSRKGDKGAYTLSPNSVSEYDFNKSLVPLIVPYLEVPYKVYDDYQASSYVGAMNFISRKLKEDGATSCVELHFNAASPSAHGHEWLYWETSKGGKRLAESFNNAMQEEYPDIRPRGIKSRTHRQRGSLFLRKTPCYACIAEPFFGSNRGDVDIIMSNLSQLAKVYADGINNFYA